MSELNNIETGKNSDLDSLIELFQQAFPDEDLIGLVTQLADDSECVHHYVARQEGHLVGSIFYTDCVLSDSGKKASLLGPLAIMPDVQHSGLGTALIEHGNAQAEVRGVASVLVLGDPAYYRRFGFTPERLITPPYPLPVEWRDAWQSMALADQAQMTPAKLVVPAPWQKPQLWGP